VQQRLGREKFDALADWRESDVFDDRERAALAYAEEATRERVVSDETFGTLRKRFSEREIAEITIVNAVENFYNFLNVPLEIPDDGLEAIAAKRHASVVARGA
jgi:alkylhydroperoxidase family enzyme